MQNTAMPSNVEIKARLENRETALQVAKQLSNSDGMVWWIMHDIVPCVSSAAQAWFDSVSEPQVNQHESSLSVAIYSSNIKSIYI